VRVKNALVSYVAYLVQAIWPLELAPYYPHPVHSIGWGLAAAAGSWLVAVTALAVWQRRHRPYLLVGWLWYLGTLLPLIGLIQVGYHARADRYVYFPLIGVFVAISWTAAKLSRRFDGQRVAAAMAGMVVSALAIVSWMQVHYWQSSVVLWENAVIVTGDNSLACGNLGMALAGVNKQQALEQFEKSIRLDPTNQSSHFSLAVLLMERLDLEGAARHFLKVTELVPHNAHAQVSHLNLGLILSERKRWDEAARHFETALRLAPDNVRAHCDMGLFLLRRGERARAYGHFQKALELAPDHPMTSLSLGTALLEEGKLDAAQQRFERAAALDPAITAMHLATLGTSYQQQGRSAEAVVCLRVVDQLRPDGDALVLEALALALADSGRFTEASAVARRAAQRVGGAHHELARRIEERAQRQQGKQQNNAPSP
jgi:protein O-mannosyl-transferase